MPMRDISATRFERRGQPVASRRKFLARMFIAIGIWIVLTLVGLAIGIAGYAEFEGMSFVDAYVNAAMILSGMGPMGELKTTAGKIFAGSYAIRSGLIIIIAPDSCWRRFSIASCIASTSSRGKSERSHRLSLVL